MIFSDYDDFFRRFSLLVFDISSTLLLFDIYDWRGKVRLIIIIQFQLLLCVYIIIEFQENTWYSIFSFMLLRSLFAMASFFFAKCFVVVVVVVEISSHDDEIM
jgi:hypothetical protein